MIEAGTKLKSTRNGEIVEVLHKESGNMKVRLADGTEKMLSDATVARWYDEVTENQPAAKKTVKKVVAKKETKVAKETKQSNSKPKKDNPSYAMAAELASTVKEHITKAGWTFLVKKEYTAIVNKAEKHLAHVWIQKSKVKFSFKKTNLLEDDKKWMVELPKHFRRSYNYQVEVTDPTLLKRCLNLLDRING